MSSKQDAVFLPPGSSESEEDAVGQAPDGVSRVGGRAAGIVPPAHPAYAPAGQAAAKGIDMCDTTLTWFRGMLLRRRCDSCGTRISILGEGDDRVIMRCPECLREYVFFRRHE